VLEGVEMAEIVGEGVSVELTLLVLLGDSPALRVVVGVPVCVGVSDGDGVIEGVLVELLVGVIV
jgi:hypothetical protein